MKDGEGKLYQGVSLAYNSSLAHDSKNLYAVVGDPSDSGGLGSSSNENPVHVLDQTKAPVEGRMNTLALAQPSYCRPLCCQRIALKCPNAARQSVGLAFGKNDDIVVGKSDPYVVFEKMFGRGSPPDDWHALIRASKQDWSKLE